MDTAPRAWPSGGGVGTFAVQLARAGGARVVAVARGWARDMLNQLGAHRFVDVDQAPVEEAVKQADLVFDLVGGQTLARSCAALPPGGVVVSVVEAPPLDGGRGVFFVVEPRRGQLVEIGARIATGEIRAVVGSTWPLRHGRAAFEAKQRPGQPGKAVLQVIAEATAS